VKYITLGELAVCLYCLESMALDFKGCNDSTADFESLFAKLESLADQTPEEAELDSNVLSVHLIDL
jgi:hypothetical protein